MNFRKALSVFAAALSVSLVTAGVMWPSASSPTQLAPADTTLNSQGYHKSNISYAGSQEFRVNGEPVASDPRVGVLEYMIPAAGFAAYTVSSPAELLAQSTPANLQVVDYHTLSPAMRANSLEQRAIAYMRDRVHRGEPVNVLLGSFYTPWAETRAQLAKGQYRTDTPAMFIYRNSLLYVEQDGGNVATVLVSSKVFSEWRWKEYYGRGSTILQAGVYFQSFEGTVVVHEMPPSRFVTEDDNFRGWFARTVVSCRATDVSSQCLYKADQKDLAVNSHQQVAVVGKVGVLEMNYPHFGDSRRVGTSYVIRNAAGQAIPVGESVSQRLPKRNSGQHIPQSVTEQVTTLRANGGTVWGSRELAKVAAFSIG